MTLAQLTALIEAENELHGPAEAGPTQRAPERGTGGDLLAFGQMAGVR